MSVPRWWWCKDCQVKWCDVDSTCWVCGTTKEQRVASSLAVNIPPMLTSQTGYYT